MITVKTKDELEQAIKDNKGESIRVEGPYAKALAKKIRSKKKIRKVAIAGGALALIGGVVAAPFTGGASLAGSAAGVVAMGATIGTITLTATELAMILGVTVYAIHKKCKIKIGKGDEFVELDPT